MIANRITLTLDKILEYAMLKFEGTFIMKTLRQLGDTWFGKDRRPYTMVRIQNNNRFEDIVVLVATGAEHSTINQDILDRFNSLEDLTIKVIITDENGKEPKEVICKPKFGPMEDRHYNSEQGVIGADIISQLRCNLYVGWSKNIFRLYY